MDTNVIYCGDCLEVMKGFKDNSIDFIYLDPPFFSKKDYENFWIKDKVTKLKFSDKNWEKLRKSIKPNILKQYEDIEKRWKGGHKGIYVYIAYMRERLEQCWRVLKLEGSIYVHCDYHASHYLKQVMDELFGYDKFKNEITWKRTSAHNDPKQFGRNSDKIFFYTKSNDYTFHTLYTKYDEEYLKTNYGNRDIKGYFKSDDLTGAGINKNDLRWKGYDPKERGRHWAISTKAIEKLVSKNKANGLSTIEKLDLLFKNKLIFFTSNRIPRFKRYLDTMKGLPLQEIWTDIPNVSSQSAERLGYPTQKPEALLNRIVKASSKEGYLILDPFCGCGTTIAVADKLNRKWIGIDISRTACDIMKRRLKKKVKVIGGESEKELRKMEPHEFARLIIAEKLNGTPNPKKSGDLGIDGWTDFMQVPIQVKRWGHKVGRQEIDKFYRAIIRDHKKKGIIVAFDFSKDSWNEIEKIKNEDKIEIQLKTVKEIFNHN